MAALNRYNGSQVNVLNTLNTIINRMASYSGQISNIDGKIKSLEGTISQAQNALNNMRDTANSAGNSAISAMGNAANAASRAENNSRRSALQAEIARATAQAESGGGYSSYAETRIERLQNELDSLPKYKTGTLSALGGLSITGELGNELIIRRPSQGRLTSLETGDGVVPADLTKNLMDWGKINPQAMMASQFAVTLPTNLISNNSQSNYPAIDASITINGSMADKAILEKLVQAQNALPKKIFDMMDTQRSNLGIKPNIKNVQ